MRRPHHPSTVLVKAPNVVCLFLSPVFQPAIVRHSRSHPQNCTPRPCPHTLRPCVQTSSEQHERTGGSTGTVADPKKPEAVHGSMLENNDWRCLGRDIQFSLRTTLSSTPRPPPPNPPTLPEAPHLYTRQPSASNWKYQPAKPTPCTRHPEVFPGTKLRCVPAVPREQVNCMLVQHCIPSSPSH